MTINVWVLNQVQDDRGVVGMTKRGARNDKE